MKIVVILADTGTQDPQGKLNLLGAGWTQTESGPNGLTPDSAVAVFIEVPWDRCNRELDVVLELLTEDGHPVLLPVDGGPQPLRVGQRLVVPPPGGAPNGSPGQAALLANFQGGLPLTPGSWYKWRVTVDKEENDAWQARFFVRRRQSTPTFGSPRSALDPS